MSETQNEVDNIKRSRIATMNAVRLGVAIALFLAAGYFIKLGLDERADMEAAKEIEKQLGVNDASFDEVTDSINRSSWQHFGVALVPAIVGLSLISYSWVSARRREGRKP